MGHSIDKFVFLLYTHFNNKSTLWYSLGVDNIGEYKYNIFVRFQRQIIPLCVFRTHFLYK